MENSSCNIIISKEIFNAINDLILYINYAETINFIKINNLCLKDLNISSNILLLDNFIIPEITNYDIYVNENKDGKKEVQI